MAHRKTFTRGTGALLLATCLTCNGGSALAGGEISEIINADTQLQIQVQADVNQTYQVGLPGDQVYSVALWWSEQNAAMNVISVANGGSITSTSLGIEALIGAQTELGSTIASTINQSNASNSPGDVGFNLSLSNAQAATSAHDVGIANSGSIAAADTGIMGSVRDTSELLANANEVANQAVTSAGSGRTFINDRQEHSQKSTATNVVNVGNSGAVMSGAGGVIGDVITISKLESAGNQIATQVNASAGSGEAAIHQVAATSQSATRANLVSVINGGKVTSDGGGVLAMSLNGAWLTARRLQALAQLSVPTVSGRTLVTQNVEVNQSDDFQNTAKAMNSGRVASAGPGVVALAGGQAALQGVYNQLSAHTNQDSASTGRVAEFAAGNVQGVTAVNTAVALNTGTVVSRGTGVSGEMLGIALLNTTSNQNYAQALGGSSSGSMGVTHDLDSAQSVAALNTVDVANTGSVVAAGNGLEALGVDITMMQARIEQAAVETNAGSQAPNIMGKQTSLIAQTVSTVNSLEVRNSGDVRAGANGVVAVVQETAVLSANVAQGVVQTNSTSGGNMATQTAVVDQRASTVNQIEVANDGTITAAKDGIVASATRQITQNTTVTQSSTGTGDNMSAQSSTVNSFSTSKSVISITNAGSVEAGGTGILAAVSGLGAAGSITISNSGRVISESGTAIRFDGQTVNVLDLAEPSFIGGAMQLDGETTVNVATGKSASRLWTFEGAMMGGAPNVSGSGKTFYNATTQQLATMDTTGFAADYSILGDVSGMISAIITRHLDGGFAAAVPASGRAEAAELQQPGGIVPTADVPPPAPASGLWMSVEGGTSREDGSDRYYGTRFDYGSLLAGYDWQYDEQNRVGLLAGYLTGRISGNDSTYSDTYDGDTQAAYLSGYGRRYMGEFFIDYALTGGATWNSGRRFVNDNLAYLGNSHAKSDTNGYWLAPELGVGAKVALSDGFALVPSVHALYATQWIDSYDETGSDGGAEVGSRNIALGQGRAELAAVATTYFGDVTSRVGVMGRTALGDEDVQVTLVGQTQSLPVDYQGLAAGYAAVDVKMMPSPATAIVAGAQITFNDEVVGYDGRITFSHSF